MPPDHDTTSPDRNNAERWRLWVSDNRVGVAKSLHATNAAGDTRTMVEAVSAKANSEWKDVLRADPCCYCGGPGGTVDHIAPRSMGGSTWSLRNWTGACMRCNLRRGSRRLIYFLMDAVDETALARHDAIKAERQKSRFDLGPRIRAAIAGVTDKAERRRIAESIIEQDQGARIERKRAWKRTKRRVQRQLVGIGQTALDDPTARQGRRHTKFGTLGRR